MNFIGEIAALVTAVCWAFTSIIFTEQSRKVGAVTVNLGRLFFAGMYLLITVLVFNLDLNLQSAQYFYLIASGFFGLVFGDSFLYIAYKRIGPRLGMLMLSLAPVITSLISFAFLGEIISPIGMLGIFLTVSGVAFVVLQKKKSELNKKGVDKIGILFGLFAAIGQGIGLVFTKAAFAGSELNSFVAGFIRVFVGFLFLWPMRHILRDYLPVKEVIAKHKKSFLIISIGAIIGPFLGITLSIFAISQTKVGIASAIMATVPIILLPMVKVYYKENLGWKAIIGAFVAVIGVSILFLR